MEFDEGDVEKQINEAVSTLSPGDEAEIAFFGGSFTGIDRDLMIRLLETSDKYVKSGAVSAVRCSTRPDYINDEILEILKSHNVKTVELGIQSTDPRVLSVCRRGHTPEAAYEAMAAVKKAGLNLVGQMMISLPGSTPESEIATAEAICRAGADGARVYPTVVFAKTELADMTKAGAYLPPSLDETIERCANVLDVFDAHNVPLIRVGLCASDNLSDPEEAIAGASHPAVGELSMSRVFRRRIDAQLKKCSDVRGRNAVLEVSKGSTSKAVGQHRENLVYLREKYGVREIKILENNSLIGYNIILSIL